MSEDVVKFDDLGRMRAVMHPARWRVLTALYGGGVLTATQAAELTGLSPSAMSYHLQQLARLGLIARESSGDGRERPWRAVGDGLAMSAQPDAAVGATMMRNLLTDLARLLGTGPPERPEDRPWPASFSHARLRLTRDEAKALHQRVEAVMGDTEAALVDADAGAVYDLYWIQGVDGGGEAATP